MAFAGLVVLLSVGLAHAVSPWWWLLAAFAGLVFTRDSTLQASITGVCPAAIVFRKLGVPSGCVFQ